MATDVPTALPQPVHATFTGPPFPTEHPNHRRPVTFVGTVVGFLDGPRFGSNTLVQVHPISEAFPYVLGHFGGLGLVAQWGTAAFREAQAHLLRLPTMVTVSKVVLPDGTWSGLAALNQMLPKAFGLPAQPNKQRR
jgi:hypothetical protein